MESNDSLPSETETKSHKIKKGISIAKDQAKTITNHLTGFAKTQWTKRDQYLSAAQNLSKKSFSTFKENQDQVKEKLKSKFHLFKNKIHSVQFNKAFFKDKLELLQSKETWKKFGSKLQHGIQHFDAQVALEKLAKFFQNKGNSVSIPLVTITVSSFFIADIGSLLLENYLPDPKPQQKIYLQGQLSKNKKVQDYAAIWNRNLVNSKGLIPGEEVAGSIDTGGIATKTTLPFNLVGTLILSNHLLSIATIEDKSLSIVYPVQIDDEIPGKIRIVEIEPKKVTFINLNSGRKEYIDMPEDRASTPRPVLSTKGSGIERLSATQFNLPRSEVDRALGGDFNNILTQARAIPNFENGVPAGFRMDQIVAGSIYEKLGLLNGDIVTGLNGQNMNDMSKALEMLGELKTANHLELQIKRNGKVLNHSYDINN